MSAHQVNANRPSFCLLADNAKLASIFINRGFTRQLSIHKADVVVFSGRMSVTPFLYGEKSLEGISYNIGKDKKEVAIFKKLPNKVIKVGFNRGALLLNILCGGRSYQMVSGHNDEEHLVYEQGHEKETQFNVFSNHEQMMITGPMGDTLLYAKEAIHKRGEKGHIVLQETGLQYVREPEVVLYPSFRTVCCQYELGNNKWPLPENFLFNVLDERLFEYSGITGADTLRSDSEIAAELAKNKDS